MTDIGSAYRSYRWRQACGALGLGHFAPSAIHGAPRMRSSASSRSVCPSEPMPRPTPPRSGVGRPSPLQRRPHTTLANQPPIASLGQTQFLGSALGTAPSSRPGSPDDRIPGPGQASPKATGHRRRALHPCGGPTLRSRSPQEGSMLDAMNNVRDNDVEVMRP